MDRRLRTSVELYLLKAESSDFTLQHEPLIAQKKPCSKGIFSLLHLLESISYPYLYRGSASSSRCRDTARTPCTTLQGLEKAVV